MERITIYDANEVKWTFGDVVIHDSDRKDQSMLMEVIGVMTKDRLKTRYIFAGKPTIEYINKSILLHDPARFNIEIPQCFRKVPDGEFPVGTLNNLSRDDLICNWVVMNDKGLTDSFMKKVAAEIVPTIYAYIDDILRSAYVEVMRGEEDESS